MDDSGIFAQLADSPKIKEKMLTRIEVEKTYWIGMKHEQKSELLVALLKIIAFEKECSASNKLFSGFELEVLDELRKVLLNA